MMSHTGWAGTYAHLHRLQNTSKYRIVPCKEHWIHYHDYVPNTNLSLSHNRYFQSVKSTNPDVILSCDGVYRCCGANTCCFKWFIW